jgi:hypothetical protein
MSLLLLGLLSPHSKGIIVGGLGGVPIHHDSWGGPNLARLDVPRDQLIWGVGL